MTLYSFKVPESASGLSNPFLSHCERPPPFAHGGKLPNRGGARPSPASPSVPFPTPAVLGTRVGCGADGRGGLPSLGMARGGRGATAQQASGAGASSGVAPPASSLRPDGPRRSQGRARVLQAAGESRWGLEEMQGERSDALRQPLCCHQRPLLSSQGRSAWNCSFFQCCVFLLDHTLLWSFVHGTRALFCFNVAICRVVLMPEGLEGLSDCDERTRAALGVYVCVCVCVCVGVWGL